MYAVVRLWSVPATQSVPTINIIFTMSEEVNPSISAGQFQQASFECFHRKAATTELKTSGFFAAIVDELNGLPIHEDFSQSDIPLQLCQHILQDEAENLGFPAMTVSAPQDGPHLDLHDKGASAALSKLCEMFILEITHRSYHLRDANRGSTLTKEDILKAIKTTEIYDLFLDHLNDLTSD
jgi:hypothetical protein